MLLITLAASRHGRHLISVVKEKGIPFRALVHRLEQAEDLKTNLNVQDVHVAEFTDNLGLKKALEGVTSVWLVVPPLNENEIKIGCTMIDAAKEAGVKHFVFCSVYHPHIDYLLNHRSKLTIEQHLISQFYNPCTIWTITILKKSWKMVF
jgi:uncharacterized protein YbjT (DUF2867 family)